MMAPVIPRVSVIIPCYYQARWLPDTIESVLAKERGDVESVVVDDGSTNETLTIVSCAVERGGRA